MSIKALTRRAREARIWMFEEAFPLWSTAGLGEAGLFLETLDMSHKPLVTETTRVRVQARQTYVFAEALRMGWSPDMARDLVRDGVATLSGPARRGEGLVGRTLNADGSGLVDDTADLYDAAFTLFALAHAAQVLGAEGDVATASARQLLDAMDAHMRDAMHGGYAEVLPRPQQRLQNPHMHLFEACLALDLADPDGGHMARAGDILSLFLAHLAGDEMGLLGERFKADWAQETGDAYDVIEPGHQFEWVWLLSAHAGRIGAAPPPEAARLYTFATSTTDTAGRAIQAVTRSGDPVDASRRTWPQTEALKAHLAMYEATRDDTYAHAACRSFDVLMDEYLSDEGGWTDHFDADGAALSTVMPASTGYHVVLAFAELLRVTDL